MNININETAASAVKAVGMVAGSAASGSQAVEQVFGVSGQNIIWWITVSYGVLQLFKCLPWFVDQTRALWRGLRHGDWSAWWRIARRGESTSDDAEL
jgi:hypothetical protein